MLVSRMAEYFLNQKWLERNFIAPKSILSKFAVHRHFNSPWSHKGNTLQEEFVQISCLSIVFSGNLLLADGGRSELGLPWQWTCGTPGTTWGQHSCQHPAARSAGQEWKMNLREMNLKKRHKHDTKRRGAGLKLRRST